MAQVQIVPYEDEHLRAIIPRYEQNEVMIGKTHGIHVTGPAWTGFINGEIVAIGGIRPVFSPMDNIVGEGWLATSCAVNKYKKTFHKHFTKHLNRVQREYDFDMLMVGVRSDVPGGTKWIEHLGFEKVEGDQYPYGREMGEFLRYRRVLK